MMPTNATLRSLPADLRVDGGGTIRVGRTRITFDLVIEEYQDGAAAEDIVARYTAVQLPEVYTAITWYLHHREVADDYLTERRAKAEANREEIQSRFPVGSLREQLAARWEAKRRKLGAP